MTLETDLSRKPYFDDFAEDKNFHQVLYRPAVAVQARELNQMQSILQDQIDKFGRHVFKDGSVVEGCAFTFDNAYSYVKIKDNFANNSAISNINDFQDRIAVNSNGLRARVVNTLPGYESENPDLNTLYIKYLNAATFSNGAQQTVFSNNEVLQIQTESEVNIGNVVVATVANSTGLGYAFTTTEGVIFKKGFFIRVEPQTLIVTKYNNYPNDISVGFDVDESIITPDIDTTLLDNAAGSPNYEAPGAHRLKLTPRLTTRELSSSNTRPFFSLCDFQNGVPITIKNDPQYAALGKEQARKTYETNGDFVVNPFTLRTTTRITNTGLSNTTHLNLVTSPGIGYVKGNRVELLNNSTVPLRKGDDTERVLNQVVGLNFGYYFRVNEYCGDFNSDQIVQVELHKVTETAITGRQFLGISRFASERIGTAYVRGVAHEAGTPGTPDATYLLYLFNVRLESGFSINDAKSIIYFDGSTVRAVADIVLQLNAATSSNVAVIQEAAGETMIYRFGQRALVANGFSNQEFVYRNKGTASFQTTGVATVTITTTVPGGTDSIIPTGTYSSNMKDKLLVVPTSNGFSTNLAGGVSVYSTNTLIVGNGGTTFTTSYIPGDYIRTNSETRRIVNITNNSHMFVDANFTSNAGPNAVHQKAFPAGVPINLEPATRTVSATSSTLTISLGIAANDVFASTFYFDVNRETNVAITKNLVRGALVRLNLANNAAGATGPWCLGLPDVFRINHVYVGTANSYSNTNPDLVNFFGLDNGQRDAHYDLAYLTTRRLLPNTASILVDLDHFTTNTSQGVGFFNASSYPIDDANTANTSAIQTYQIPTYTTKTTKELYDLRDSVDFRPFAIATAVSTNTVGSSTINPANTLTFFSYGANGSFLPVPDSSYGSDISYYLPRKDRVSLSSTGSIVITEGASTLTPVLPAEPPGTMTLATVDVTPYPSLDIATARRFNRYDYAVQLNTQQTKRYTMAQIGTLAKRIDNLEYYTSLSLLEQAATSLLVRSSETGENRFKNGILVDPFRDHTIGNTLNPQYKIAVDSNRNELRPAFSLSKIPMAYDPVASTNVTRTGDLVTLPYNSVVNQVQRFASTNQSLTIGKPYGYRGSMILSPPGEVDPDYGNNPDVINNADLYSNWVNLRRAWSTQWGAWTDSNLSVAPSSAVVEKANSQTTKSLAEQTQAINRQLATAPTDSSITVGEFVTNASLQPFLRSKFIFFTARGLKPFARMYPYFADSDVSQICMPIRPYTGSTQLVNGQVRSTPNNLPVARDTYGNVYEYNYSGTDYGSPLIADADGTVYGVMRIPPRTFRAAELEFKLLDTPTLTVSGVTTQASAIFYGTALSVQKDKINLQIRPVVNITNEITEITNISQTVNNTTVINNNNTTVINNTTVVTSPPPNPSGVSAPPNPDLTPQPPIVQPPVYSYPSYEGGGSSDGSWDNPVSVDTSTPSSSISDAQAGVSDATGGPADAGPSQSISDGQAGFSDSTGGGPGGESSGGKIVCTAMNEAYGFGSYRNAIWLAYSAKNMSKAHEVGYHTIFLPLVKAAYRESHWYSKPLRQTLEHIARHRTADLRGEMRNSKRDKLGRAYRIVLEPLCYVVGKMKGH